MAGGGGARRHACKSKPSTACDEVRCRGINRVCRYHGSQFHLAGRETEKHKEPPGKGEGAAEKQKQTDRQTVCCPLSFSNLQQLFNPFLSSFLPQLPLSVRGAHRKFSKREALVGGKEKTQPGQDFSCFMKSFSKLRIQGPEPKKCLTKYLQIQKKW